MLKVTKRMLDNPNLNSGLEKPIGLKILNLHNEIRIQQSKIAIQFLDNIEKMIDINNYSATPARTTSSNHYYVLHVLCKMENTTYCMLFALAVVVASLLLA